MIYVHIPFCKSFCTYCGFYSELPARLCGKGGERGLFREFTETLCREIAARSGEIAATTSCNTLYIGGGTPSLLPLDCLRQIAAAAGRASDAAVEIAAGTAAGAAAKDTTGTAAGKFSEFTVEMNPDDVVGGGERWAESLLRMGVTRASLGVQSLDDGVLRKMNRRHDASAAIRAYRILESAGFTDISTDLIFGLPDWFSVGSSIDRLCRDLDALLAISSSGDVPKHISAYQLSVEEGSALEKRISRHPALTEASQELCAAQYETVCRRLADAGYHHYEISNFALPGYEAVHNSAYWDYVPYVGVGPAAHSFGRTSEPGFFIRKWNPADYATWKEQVINGSENSDSVLSGGSETLTPAQVAEERIMLGLRTDRGVPKDYLVSHCDSGALARETASAHLVPAGGSGNRLRIPENHFFISDNIISSLFQA